MATNDGIFSIRLVVADFYMEKPVPGLDPVYSEFRGKEIKKVPNIRVFGSNAQGQKTCMHVHGVFPYFYVPYDQKDFESVNKAIYQIAINLDKAINISLSQGSSAVQHVFKVQLVKGIPFYGYHRSDHQYLKIYMFNPRFVRRAANLLQNGAIMNKNFHPHEAHVPYILQFMIDYNLYGMSFIHVPSEIVKFRRSDASEVIPFKNLKESQILDCNMAKKLSCSKLECDIGSSFILNRFQLITKTSTTHSNPGIESIWNDEKLRRQKMAQTLEDDEEKLNAIPPLEVPSTQERPNVYPTESETFYRTALVSKLLVMETSTLENTQMSDETINCTLQSNITNITNINLNTSVATMKQHKRTFNLSKILQNSVYPEECSQNGNLVNASFVENHLSNNNAFQQSLSMDLPELTPGNDDRKLSEDDESAFLEDTIVDEELVLSLTQSQEPHVPHNATLRDEDKELLNILQQLEEDNDGKIDLDSSLAPLTQNHTNFALSPELLDKETTASVMQKPSTDLDSDEENETDDNIHDFSIALENLDDLILKLTQSATENSLASPLPQTDGSDDLPKTPTKSSSKITATAKTPPRTPTTPKQRRLTLASPSRSPRTPKSGHKYKPLPLVITNRSTGKTIFPNPGGDITTPCKTSFVEKSNNLPSVSLRKKLAMTELRRKSISLDTDYQDNQNVLAGISKSSNVTKRRSKRFIDLDKTHITCNLTPRRTNDKLLKVYNVESNDNEPHKEDLKEKESRKSIPAKANVHSTRKGLRKDSKVSEASEGIKTKQISKNVTEKPKQNMQLNDEVKENEIKIKSSDNVNDDNNANSQEANEEILDSDNEAECSSLHLRKTPNLKRLRRSFLSTHSAKRRKFAGNDDDAINSSKFINPNTLPNSTNEVQEGKQRTMAKDESVMNSSEFEKVSSEKAKQQEAKQILPKPHVDMDMDKCYSNLMSLTDALNKMGQLKSAGNTEVLKESVNNYSTREKGKVLRKSKRNTSHAQEDISERSHTKLTEKSPSVSGHSEAAVKILCTGTIPKATNESASRSEGLPSSLKAREDITSKKCRVRLKKISNDHPKSAKDLGVVEISEESPAEKLNGNSKKKNALGLLQTIEESEESVKTSPETMMAEIPKRMTMSGIVKLSEESKESLKTLAKTMRWSDKPLPLTNLKMQSTCGLNNETPDYSAKSSEQTKPLSIAHIHSSNTDNILKCLLKLTSTNTNECSPEVLPLDPMNRYSSQASSIELVAESPLANNDDNSKVLKSVKSSRPIKPSMASFAHSSNTDNILKCLLNLTSTETNECHADLLPLDPMNSYPSQSSSIEFIAESPLANNDDNSKSLTSVKSSAPIKPTMAYLQPSNTDNILNSLLKLTSTDTNECSPEVLPLALLNSYPSQSSSIEFVADSPLANNEENSTALPSIKSSATMKPSSAPLHSSNSDNLLKSLLKLTSTESNECRRAESSPSLEDIVDLPLAPTSCYRSQSPSLEFHTESPLPHSSDEEIAETPPPPSDHDDPKVVSFYEKSMSLYSPLLFTQNSSPSIMPQNKHLRHSRLNSSENSSREAAFIVISSSSETTSNAQHHCSPPSDSRVVLTPMDLPPTRDEVLKGCIKLKLPEYEFQQPFYSNPDDVTKQKEVGFTILQINSNKLNDLEEFQSILGVDVKGLAAWRRNQLVLLGGPQMLTKYRNTQRIREYFAANHKTVAITPQTKAPTKQEVKLWLKARELLKNKGVLKEDDDGGVKMRHLNEEDSPIKVRRQKIAMMLNEGDGGGGGADDSDNSLDCSARSLCLTPLTPATPLAKDTLTEKINKSFTPVTTKFERIPLERLTSLKRRDNRRVLRRVPLNQKLKEALEGSQSSQSGKSSQDSVVIAASEESIVPHSQTSETSVSSQTALAEMERSSFMRQIEANDVAMLGGSNNNSTLNNTFGFKVALENLQQAKADIEFNYLTIVTLEVFVATRDDLVPNPQIDEIRCLFYAIENSIPNDHIDNDKKLPRTACGYIMVHDPRDVVTKEGRIHGIDRDIEVTIVQTEVQALEALLGLCSRWDPDIYAGYEIEMCSWGFVMDRAKYLCLNIAPLLSRVPTQKMRDFVDEDREQFTDLDVEMKLCGRILLDVWRLMRSEIALTSYTFENVMYHILHKRCPWHSYRALTEWFSSPGSRWIVLEYFLERVRGTLALLDQLDLIGRTSEMAKLIGIQFYEVLSRGSQFRVESMMLRIAKPKNLVPLSPSVQQRAHMRAPEYLALILEPQSRFYADPLIVLDFQSLYPSMIIGYNYCFSTCLGRVEHLGQSTPFEFGASQLRVSPSMLRKLVDRDLITISPCGVVFVKASVREGILPRMLTEILDTRQMVKQSMKVHKSNSALQRILHSRQLGLKLMANVTYGYTAANFSGRMPAVEVGDSVVSKGRETLERAIKTVEANEKWNVKVVYGDTDSMFVLVPGRNREEAFRIGEEIAEAVTKQNPHPVKLKLEKVYQPCILQTKKRYVGYMYETADQKEPVYEAKGIETVRRDGCPMVAKMLEKVLRILFETADVSQVKQYVCRQFTKLLSGRANLQDLIFAKEFRGMNGYKPTACVPALELTRRWIQTDPRRIPRRGERVPFIITNGPPGVPLIRLIRHPHEVLADEGLKINAVYYITKAIIPPLNRCLLLLGADVNDWFTNLPRKILMTPALSIANEVITCPNSKSKKSTISQFFSTTNCIVDCGRQTKQGICDVCNCNATRSMVILQTKISKIERAFLSTQHICQSCCGRVGDLKCGSLDCPVLYVLEGKRRDLQQITHFRNLLEERF